MTEMTIVELAEQPTAGVREQVPLAAMRDFFDRAFAAVMGALQVAGAAPAGPPYGRYRGEPGQTVDVEAGFPVTAPIPGDGTVQPGVLPAGRAVEAIHVGPYDELGRTYDEVVTWMQQQGLQPTDEMWEEYLTEPGPGSDPSTWLTKVVVPVAG